MKKYCPFCPGPWEDAPINMNPKMVHYSTGMWICPICGSTYNEKTGEWKNGKKEGNP